MLVENQNPVEIGTNGSGAPGIDGAPQNRAPQAHNRLPTTAAGFVYTTETPPKKTTPKPHSGRLEIAPSPSFDLYMRGATGLALRQAAWGMQETGFPTLRAAAAWAQIETATSNENLPLGERGDLLKEAEANLKAAQDGLSHIYQTYPEQCLVWPGTYWRWQAVVDCMPTARALAEQRASHSAQFETALLDQSRANLQDTMNRILTKFDETRLEDDTPSERERFRSRRGVLLGNMSEFAAVELQQRALGNTGAVLPPSLRLDGAGNGGSDMSIQWPRVAPSAKAQIKIEVKREDTKKYIRTRLICVKHDMAIGNMDLLETFRAIANGTNRKALLEIGRNLADITRGKQTGCCPRTRNRHVPLRSLVKLQM